MDAQDSGGAGMAIGFGEEADGVLAGGGDSPEVEHDVHQFGMIVRPALGADAAPQAGFLRAGDADGDAAAGEGRGFSGRLDGAIEDAAQFDGRVASFA